MIIEDGSIIKQRCPIDHTLMRLHRPQFPNASLYSSILLQPVFNLSKPRPTVGNDLNGLHFLKDFAQLHVLLIEIAFGQLFSLFFLLNRLEDGLFRNVVIHVFHGWLWKQGLHPSDALGNLLILSFDVTFREDVFFNLGDQVLILFEFQEDLIFLWYKRVGLYHTIKHWGDSTDVNRFLLRITVVIEYVLIQPILYVNDRRVAILLSLLLDFVKLFLIQEEFKLSFEFNTGVIQLNKPLFWRSDQ